MQIVAGVRIASFEVRGQIGSGGMGTVYRAHDSRLGRDVAIKILQDRLAGDESYLRRFQREAKSASALNHPNIVTVYEIGEFDGAPFIAMELVEGTTVRELIRRDGLPMRKLLNIATQVAEGLAAAHEKGIVHRDVKPENVMITANGHVKILDFGLARPPRRQSTSDDDSTDEITRDSGRKLVGTIAYMSPEQVAGAELDYRSDQFSFGSMLYEMATGRRAFRRDSTVDTLEAIKRDEPEPLQRLLPRAPAPLCWIVERCLAKDAHDRYASTTDLAKELATLRDRLAETNSGEHVAVEGFWSRRRAVIAGFGSAAVIASVLFVANRAILQQPAPIATARTYLAILPFRETSGPGASTFFSRGFAEVVSRRLARSPALQVIPPTSTAPLVAKGVGDQQIAEELGATLILKGTIHRTADSIRVAYAIVDSGRGTTLAQEEVEGPAENVWAVQDELSDAVARTLGVAGTLPSAQEAELETAEEQDLYLRALGHLQDYENERSLDESLAALRELLESASGSPAVHSALARTYVQKYVLTKDRTYSDRAVQAAERSRVLAPDSPEVLLALANVQRLTGRAREAIGTFKRALALQPNSPESVIWLATAYQSNGQLDEAERAFRRGITLRPSWWSGHNELGVMYLAGGRLDDAAKEFARVIELNPKSPWGYSNLGVVHVLKQRLPDAIAAFTKAVSIRDDPSAHANLAYCFYYLGQYDKSAAAYRKAIALRPKFGGNWANLADTCRWTKTCTAEVENANTKAIELLRDELAINPRNARVHAVLAVCLAKRGERTTALEHIQEALKLEPKNPARLFQAARVANLSGNQSEAIQWLRRAMEAGYGDFEVQRDPEFQKLRETEAFRSAFKKSEQPT